MSVKPQTKLMKFVCKQAALMREPYHNPPWTTHQINNVHKKETNVKKLNQTSKSINKIKRITPKTSSPNEKNKPLSKEVNQSNEVIATAMNEELVKII